MQLQVRWVEVVVVVIGQPSFVYVLWVHCDFDLMIFLEREVEEQEDGVVEWVDCPLAEQLLPLISTEKVHAVAKSTLSKVQIPRCRKGQSPTTLSEVGAVQSPTLSKKKKVKILRESDSIGRASQRPRTRLDECPDPVGSRPAPHTFPDPSPESDSSRFARSLNLPNSVCVVPRMYSLVQWNWFSDVTDACNSGASSDHREPISLHRAVQSGVVKLVPDVTGCMKFRCIQWPQRTNFTAPGCTYTNEQWLYYDHPSPKVPSSRSSWRRFPLSLIVFTSCRSVANNPLLCDAQMCDWVHRLSNAVTVRLPRCANLKTTTVSGYCGEFQDLIEKNFSHYFKSLSLSLLPTLFTYGLQRHSAATGVATGKFGSKQR